MSEDINDKCPTCRFNNKQGNFCENQGSSFYYRAIPNKSITCSVYLIRKNTVKK